MEKEYLIKLTCSVYKLTELFPQKEPLKFLIREKSGEILADAQALVGETVGGQKAISSLADNIEVIKSFFDVAKEQEWVDRTNFFILSQEYSKLQMEAEHILFESALEQGAGAGAGEALGLTIAGKEDWNGGTGSSSSSSSRQDRVQANEFSQNRENSIKVSAVKKEIIGFDDLKKTRHKKIVKILERKGQAQIRDFKEMFPDLTKRTLRRDMDFLLRAGLVERKGDRNRTVYVLKDRARL